LVVRGRRVTTVDWIERSSAAGESWPADDLRVRRPGSVIALRLGNGETIAGVLSSLTADTIELDVDEGPFEVDVRSVDAYAVVPEPGD
jgi:hypothetical protein